MGIFVIGHQRIILTGVLPIRYRPACVPGFQAVLIRYVQYYTNLTNMVTVKENTLGIQTRNHIRVKKRVVTCMSQVLLEIE